MTNTLNITSWGETLLCKAAFDRYTNGRLALTLLYWDEEMEGWFPHAKVSVNLPDQHLNEGELFIKDWAENEPIVAALVEAGWLKDTGREVLSGYVVPRVMTMEGDLLDLFKGE